MTGSPRPPSRAAKRAQSRAPQRPWLRATSVRSRLMLLAAVFALLVTAGGVVALVGLRDSLARTERNTTVVSPAQDANRDVENTMITAQSSLRGYLVANASLRSGVKSGSLSTSDFLQRYSDAEARYKSDLTRVDSLLSRAEYTSDPDVRSALETLRQRQRSAVEAWWDFSRSARSRFDLDPSFLASGDALFDAFETSNAALTSRLVEQRDALRVSMTETIQQTQRQVLVATLVALLGATAFGWWTIRGLTVPLARLRDTCRRQAAGSRTAWADEDRGAREVRELARGLNALTAAQHGLLDEHAYALALAQTTRELGRRIQDAPDVASAFVIGVAGVGATLQAEHGTCLVTQAVGSDSGICAVWTPQDGASPRRVGEQALLAMQDDVRRLWNGDRCLVIDDVAAAQLALPLLEGHPAVPGGAIIAAFGTGETPRGIIAVQSVTESGWSPAQASFVQAVAAELGRAVEAAEVGRARVEHVERLEELDRQKDSFLSTVSHELRTPLTSINGYLELLEDGDAGRLTGEQQQMLSVIDRNATRLRDLIEDLLLINRMRDGVAGDAEDIDMDRLVRHAVEEMAPLAKAKGVILDGTSMTDVRVEGNRAQLARVLTNLLSNAVKFTPGGGHVRVRTLRAVGGDTVRIICADEGMGIPAAEQAKLFTRFFRASNATREEVPGTGLGLVVVKGIVEAHGGRLQVSSAEGAGTTVVVELPVTRIARVKAV